MSKLSYIVTGSGRISAVANGSSYTVNTDHPNYNQIKECLKKQDADQFIRLADIPKAVDTYSGGKVKVVNGRVMYGDREIQTSLTKRILWMLDEGFDVSPFIKFLENLMQNPSRRAVQELYSWMEHQDIPITTDGCWIGYKRLQSVQDRMPGEPTDRPIYIDVHSRTIRQWLGKVVSMERNECDENWGTECSQGLHVGSASYRFSGDVKVLVKVNPKDVVSVPSSETNKCRVCAYEIVEVYNEDFNTPVVGPKGEKIDPKARGWDDVDEDDRKCGCQDCDFDDEDDDDFDDEGCEYCGEEDCYGECFDESDQ